jgi:hypothetical protein
LYLKGVLVVGLCSAFVVAAVAALAFVAAGVGGHGGPAPTTGSACEGSAGPCVAFSISDASLRTANYTDDLGRVTYAELTLRVNDSGAAQIEGLAFYIGNDSAGEVAVRILPGGSSMVQVTVPATLQVVSGKTYLVSVEATGGGSPPAWGSVSLTAS